MAFVSSALGFLQRPRQVRELDHYNYIAMAGAPVGRAEDPRGLERPFCYRILVPALVRAVVNGTGVGLNAVFWSVTQLALVAYLFTLFLCLRDLGFAADAALVGTALAGLTPGAVRWYAYQYWMSDPVCLWLVALGFLLARRERLLPLSVVCLAAALTRESWLLIPAYALLRRQRSQPRRGLLPLLLAFVPACVATVAVRLAIVPVAGSTLLEAAREMLRFRARHLLDNQLYFATLGSFGVLVPLVLLRARRAWDAARSRPEDAAVVVLVYGSLAIANNTDRLLVYALPVVLPPALRAIEALGTVAGRPTALVAALVAQGVFYALTPGWGIAGLSLYQPVSWAVVLLCALVLGVGVVALGRYSS